MIVKQSFVENFSVRHLPLIGLMPLYILTNPEYN